MITYSSQNKESALLPLIRSGQTIFTVRELAMLWQVSDVNYLKNKIYRLVKNGSLLRLRKGIYSFKTDYQQYELAGKLLSPSYISLQTVLKEAGVIFQFHADIFSVGKLSRRLVVGDTGYVYHKIKSDILLNPRGINQEKNQGIASLSRAFLDSLYLYQDIHLDNLRPINWEECFDLVSIYMSKILRTRLQSYHEDYTNA